MPSAGLEGELLVAISVAHGRVSGVRIASSRPDVAGTMLQGATRGEIGAAVPLLFAVCSRSQSAAAELVCAAAAGEAIEVAGLERHRAAVNAEMLREGAWRMLLEGPRALGEVPSAQAVSAARRAMAFDGSVAASDAVAMACFGTSASTWFSDHDDERTLRRWLEEGGTATARVMRRLCDATSGAPCSATPWLPSPPDEQDLASIDLALAADAMFSRAPTWHGRPAETGALTRRCDDPLVIALAANSRPLARAVARLREFAELLTGRAQARLGVQRAADGSALAWVENSRGLLVHQALLVDGRAARYRVVAPTEWNFHPEGALKAELIDTPVGAGEELQRRAAWLAHSLDPCVSCRIEVLDA
jgi:hypothetical protein